MKTTLLIKFLFDSVMTSEYSKNLNFDLQTFATITSNTQKKN